MREILILFHSNSNQVSDLCRLISTFVFCFLQSLSKLASFAIPIVQLVSVAEHIIFVADCICISMKLSCVQDISELVGGLEPNFHGYNWGMMKTSLGFGDLALILTLYSIGYFEIMTSFSMFRQH